MSFNLRLFLSYFVLLGAAIYLLLTTIMSELKPGVRQSTEDALVDMSNLLAELVHQDFVSGEINSQNFKQSMQRFLQRSYRAKISLVDKKTSQIRIYVTNKKGIVLYDSDDKALGEDYSQWNDVYLTLRGEYGARSTKADPNDEMSSVMHVAAPIKEGNEIIGVLTIAKPNLSLQPFIDKAQKTIKQQGLWLILISLVVTIAISYLLTNSIRKLVHYANETAKGNKAKVPKIPETELAKLARSMDNMRRQLEGKAYIEKYVHTLTHELKSPVSAIKGAAELINPLMPADDQIKFVGNIKLEIDRIDDLINRLLALATIEAQDTLEETSEIDLLLVLKKVLNTKLLETSSKQIDIDIETDQKSDSNPILIEGDMFLITQAIDNLLQNAIDFSPQNGRIFIKILSDEGVQLVIQDEGTGIPDYANSKVFDRFYSLARPNNSKKSSGLGLSFVKQIAHLHHGAVTIVNRPERGVEAIIRFPR